MGCTISSQNTEITDTPKPKNYKIIHVAGKKSYPKSKPHYKIQSYPHLKSHIPENDPRRPPRLNISNSNYIDYDF